ncbi:tail fiber assembly protein [Photorhabdus cinerea]|uniref:tail fiber assembly protein n=1 Tax=Photorhabdus cinerea TaxID=471575 RepID=UPI003BB78220
MKQNNRKQNCYNKQMKHFQLLQDSVDLEVATDAEKTALLEWKKYRVLLTRVDAL